MPYSAAERWGKGVDVSGQAQAADGGTLAIDGGTAKRRERGVVTLIEIPVCALVFLALYASRIRSGISLRDYDNLILLR